MSEEEKKGGEGRMHGEDKMERVKWEEEQEKVLKSLLRYCALDTLAMVVLHRALVDILQESSGKRNDCGIEG